MARKEGGKHMRTGLTRKTKEGDKKKGKMEITEEKGKGGERNREGQVRRVTLRAGET